MGEIGQMQTKAIVGINSPRFLLWSMKRRSWDPKIDASIWKFASRNWDFSPGLGKYPVEKTNG